MAIHQAGGGGAEPVLRWQHPRLHSRDKLLLVNPLREQASARFHLDSHCSPGALIRTAPVITA